MTRINIVPPELLSDKHLSAERYELPRVITAVLNAQQADKTPQDFDIPPEYRLGTGHVKFFYDKLAWVCDRLRLLHLEAATRGWDVDLLGLEKDLAHRVSTLHVHWFNDCAFSPNAYYLNMARLAKRSKMAEVIHELNQA